MTVRLTGIPGAMRALKDHLRVFEDECVMHTRNAVKRLHAELTQQTPVWSGETVRNYAWGVNRKPGGGSRGFIASPSDPGPTNSMPLGPEPRRYANVIASTSEMVAVAHSRKKLANFVVTNLIDGEKWDLLDNGNAPTAGRSRIPGGIGMLAMQSARTFLPYFK